MLHSISTGVHHAKNEEFPALVKSQPITFGTPATRLIRHASPGDFHSISQTSRKKRVKKKKQPSFDDGCHGDCHNNAHTSSKIALGIRNCDSTDLIGHNTCSQKPPSSLLKEALFPEQASLIASDSLTTFRTTEDEGFVDGVIADSLSLPVSKAPIVVGSCQCENTLVVHKHLNECDVDGPVFVGVSDSGSSSSSSSVSRLSPCPPPGLSRATVDVSKNDPLNERSMCAHCEEKFKDIQVFGSLELPQLWDPVLPRKNCCRFSGGDDGKTATNERNCSSASAINRTKTENLSGTGDNNPTYESDDLDEDEMEGTDLLHLISNSLDRFNAIVHPPALSCLTSGLGASEAILSELDCWSFTDSSTSLGQLKPTTNKGISLEKFAETHLPWFDSRQTSSSSSCPNQSSLVTRVTVGGGGSGSPLPPPLSFSSSIESSDRQSPDRESPCMGNLISHATSAAYGGNQSLGNPSPRTTTSPNGAQSFAGSVPFDSESVYPGSLSMFNANSHHQQHSTLHVSNSLINHQDARPLDTSKLICTSQAGVSVSTSERSPFSSSTAAVTTLPWITAASGTSNSNRSLLSNTTSPSETPSANPSATGFLVPELDLSSTLRCSDSGCNLDWDNLSRGLDWLSIQAGSRCGAPGSDQPALVLNPIADTDSLLAFPSLTQQQKPLVAAAHPPGFTPCSGTALGFDAIPAVNMLPVMDLQRLLNRSPFTTQTTATSTTNPIHIPQPSTSLGTNCGQSLLSTCFASGATITNNTCFDWDTKSFNGFTVPYGVPLDRSTGSAPTATPSHAPGRSRLPHSDSVSVVGDELELSRRRASVSTSPFDMTDVAAATHPRPSAIHFDSPDHLVTQLPFGSVNRGMQPPGLESSVRSGTNNTSASSGHAISSSSCCSAFLAPHSVTNHSARAGSVRFPNSAAMATGHGQPPRQVTWSAGWQARSPTLRTINGGETYRHGAPHKRFNHGPTHIPSALNDNGSTIHLSGNANRHTPVGVRGCSPAVQLSTCTKLNGHPAPSASASSSSSSSLSSASSSSGHNSTTSTAANNYIESNESGGKPVVAKWRRACSFYLRGHCKKEDCEFAHDLTKVTCKFWEMGECFKGPTCPFLHGYPPELTQV